MEKTIVILLIMVFAAGFITAQDKKVEYPLIKKLSWIAGSYQGEKWGGIIEEYWSAPQGNTREQSLEFIFYVFEFCPSLVKRVDFRLRKFGRFDCYRVEEDPL